MNLNNILKYGIFSGLLAILFLPLYVSDSMFFPFITGKNFAFRIITELIFGAWIVLAFRDISYRPKKSLILYAVAAFVGVMTIADILSENPFKSFWSNYERMEGLVTLLHLFAYFLVASSVLAAGNLWERFFQTSLGVSVILSGYGLLQLAGKLDVHQGSTRLDATFGNSAYFAVYLLFHIFIAAFLAVRHRRNMGIVLIFGAVILLDIFTLYHTATRGAILGLLGGAILTATLIALFERQNILLRKGAIGLVVAIVVFVGGFISLKDTTLVRESPVLNRFATISLHETTTKSRFMVWNMALQGFKERPVFGWGQESFNFVFNKYYDPKMYDQEPWFDRAHNVFLDWLIAGGILGLLGYLSLFASVLYLLWKRASDLSISEKSIVTGLFAAYFFHNLFVFDNLISYIFFFSLLSYFHSLYGTPWSFSTQSDVNQRKRGNENSGNTALPAVVVSPAVIVGVILVLYMVNYHPIAENLDLIQSLQRQDKLETNLNYFKKALAHNSFGDSEAREQLTMAASRVAAGGVDQKTKSEFVSLATTELEKQTVWVPHDARYQIFMGSFLNQIGNYDQALAYLKNAEALTPQKQQVYLEEANAYLNKKDYKDAVRVTKIAFELEPDYDIARIAYAMSLIYDDKKKEADDLLVQLRQKQGTEAIADERLFRAYVDTKDYKNAEAVIRGLIATDPGNYRYHLSIGALYLQEGKRQGAIDEIQKAIDLNPDFKTQGEYYIKEIKAGRNP